MELIISITIRWWNEDKDQIPAEHLEALEDAGKERALEMMQSGYTSGELIHTIGDNDEFHYNGWFEINTKKS